MGLLDNIQPGGPNRIERKVKNLKAKPSLMFQGLFNNWKDAVDAIWDDKDPQEVLDALGTDGPELFDMSRKAIGFLESIKPGCTDESIAKMKDFTIVDGKIVIS